MTRVKGSSILNHLTLINNTNESELHAYLIRLIAVSCVIYIYKYINFQVFKYNIKYSIKLINIVYLNVILSYRVDIRFSIIYISNYTHQEVINDIYRNRVLNQMRLMQQK